MEGEDTRKRERKGVVVVSVCYAGLYIGGAGSCYFVGGVSDCPNGFCHEKMLEIVVVENVRIEVVLLFMMSFICCLFSGVLVAQVPGRYVVGSHIFQKVKTPPRRGEGEVGEKGRTLGQHHKATAYVTSLY